MTDAASHDKAPLPQGRVFKKGLGKYWVKNDGKVVDCSISSKLLKELIYPTADPSSIRRVVVNVRAIKTVDPVAIGDVVSYRDAGGNSGMIMEVHPRRNKLSRRATGDKDREQVVVVNVDQVIPVFAAANPEPKWQMLDRYLASAEAAGLPAVICITKMDLVDDESLTDTLRVYEDIGYQVIVTSAATGRGIEQFKDVLKDRLSVFLGKSGVGKSTLLNVIQPGLGIRVNEVSEKTGKGRHTTSHLEMFDLTFGGGIVDTPGVREFALWDTSGRDMAQLFPEMRPYIGKCEFGIDCSHTRESECAIKQAVEAGAIAKGRYNSFLSLRG